MATSSQQAASLLLDKETDARFWLQTGYKPGQKLDMTNPTDASMAKVWTDIHNKVAAEDKAGKLVLTFNHPAVQQHVENAAAANDAAAEHVVAAAQADAAGDRAKAKHHVDQATKASQVAAGSTAAGAAMQPPTVSPAVADAAAHEAATRAGLEPHPPIAPAVVQAAPGHPANHPRAQPSHPDLARPGAPIPSHPEVPGRHHRGGHGPHVPAGAVYGEPIQPYGAGGPTVEIYPPQTVADHMALGQATTAPMVAVATHEQAAASEAAGAGASSSVSDAEQTAIGISAQQQAQAALAGGGDFVGVVLSPTNQWSASKFATGEDMMVWYGHVADAQPAPFKYLAVFDRLGKTGSGWPEPVQFMWGNPGQTLLVSSPVTRERERERIVREVVPGGVSGNGAAKAIGAVAIVTTLAALAAGRRKR